MPVDVSGCVEDKGCRTRGFLIDCWDRDEVGGEETVEVWSLFRLCSDGRANMGVVGREWECCWSVVCLERQRERERNLIYVLTLVYSTSIS